MFKLITSLLARFAALAPKPWGGSSLSLAALVAACLLPLALLQCSRSSLEDLRVRHQKLEAEYAALALSLAQCRKAASLNDAVLMAREGEAREITLKYNKLRDEIARNLGPVEGAQKHVQSSTQKQDEASFQEWCARPLPYLLHGLLAKPAAALPRSPAPSPDAK